MVSFAIATSLVHELMAAIDEKRLLRLHRRLAKVKLLIIDELGFLPLSTIGEWTETFGTERLTGAPLGRVTHHVNILEVNGESRA